MTEGGNKRTTTNNVSCSWKSSMPIPECLCKLHANRLYADSRNTQQISRLNITVKSSHRLHAVSHVYVISVLLVKSLTIHKGLTDKPTLGFPVQHILTHRRLTSSIYMEHPFLMFLDHTQRRSTVGRTPLDEWSARRRDIYLTTQNTHNRQTSMPQWDSNPRSQQASGRRPTP